jgi:2-polyprenyl-3-methyl-5-hydroxy-6-metoxy-1,4-benzoquinol methylase
VEGTLVEVPCSVCGGVRFTPVVSLAVDDFLTETRRAYLNLSSVGLDGRTVFRLRRCRRCSFVMVNPRLRPELYSVVYNEAKAARYALDGKTHLADQFEPGSVRLIETRWKYLRTLCSLLGHRVDARGRAPQGLTFLDFGCGMGHTLDLARSLGLIATGIDIDRIRLANCRQRGLEVYEPADFETQCPDRRFDLVYMQSVLEHLDDLHAAMRTVARACRPGSLLFVDGITDRAIAQERRRGRYRLVMPLEHLNYFTRRSLYRLTRSHGFVPLAPRVQCLTMRNWSQWFHYPLLRGALSLWLLPQFERVFRYVGQTSRAP